MVKQYSHLFIIGVGIVICLLPIISNAQSIQSISPTTTTNGQVLSVTISGQSAHFSQVSGVMNVSLTQTNFGQASFSIYPVSMTATNNNEVVANFLLPNCAPTGSYDVSIYDNLDGFLSLANALTLNNDPTPPHIISLSSSAATAGNTLDITISGQNTNFLQVTNTHQILFSQLGSTDFAQLQFQPASNTSPFPQSWFTQGSPTGFQAVWFGQSSTTSFFPNSITVNDNTTIVANVTIPPNLVGGNYNIAIYDLYDCIVLKTNAYTISNSSGGTGGTGGSGSTTGIENANAKEALSVYPNPFSANIYIETKEEDSFSADADIRIIDNKGLIVITKKVNSHYDKLDTQGLPPGIYNVVVNKNGKVYSTKLVKE